MSITTTWQEEKTDGLTIRSGFEGPWRYPVVSFGDTGMTWEPHHSVGKGTDEIDGQLVDPLGIRKELDIWGFKAYEEDSIDDEELARAKAEWDEGRVLMTSYGLIIPDPVIDNFEEALRRFKP